MDKYTIYVAHFSMIHILWDQVEPLIDMVVEKAPADISAPKVKEKLLNGEDALMVIAEGAEIVGIVVLTVRTLDSGIKALYLPIVAGEDIDGWINQGFDLVYKIARHYGCSELRGVSARKGWMRKLANYGWEEVFTTVRCKLGE